MDENMENKGKEDIPNYGQGNSWYPRNGGSRRAQLVPETDATGARRP